MDASYFQGIYSRALDQTGSAARAREAVSVAEAALKEIYDAAIVRTGGDNVAAAAAERRVSGQVAQLAQLIPVVRAEGDVDASAAALREMMSVLEGMGYQGGRSGMHAWLRANVPSDAVLRAAGFDARAVRTLPRPEGWPDDFEALISLLRDQLQLVQEASGGRITNAEIEAQIDVFRASAHRFGYDTTPATAAPSVEGEPAPEGTVTMTQLGIPRRI